MSLNSPGPRPLRLTAVTRSVAASMKLTANTPVLAGAARVLVLRTTATVFGAHRGEAEEHVCEGAAFPARW
ncbi:hypothetical protein [Streptomyces sp. NBC_00728]|uniref:hypothetical protein n=1 Tax=Streptomyces sp. NBC_00728 TaxID=2903676 RepID=UPI0038677630